MSKWLRFIGLFVVVAALVAGAAWQYYQYQMKQFLLQPVVISSPQVIQVLPGKSVKSLMRDWQQNGWIENANYMRWLLKRQPEFGKIRVGTYQIETDQSLLQSLEHLISGAEHQYSMTFVEGSRWADWQTQLAQADTLNSSPILNQQQALLQHLGIEHPLIEGWLYPDTYFYTQGTPSLTIVERAHDRMKQMLKEAWAKRQQESDDHIKTPYEALILASIIEKETGQPDERPTIASVFHNRFDLRMRLQTDPTVIYGMGDRYEGNITKADLREATAYNTYVIRGLPPTPIAMPGIEAIEAAINPIETDYLYFVSQGNGRHVFSKTLQEHNANVRRYILNRE
ncbi:endolytic transglycosylase MltG [Echinimonas agarilytica]|uniref:Endolytic murein transglycosylase n=1 Tax=Echinimonas agarilytica TaxID=1215918 RepID=A0AA41W6B5_9GAMM|nr:endolytic transglycosylase MltG [Echinimonas agarilytica]MCM2679860.1 endolytic transglycosylase MltG [Echinimonas agarilytica]